MSKAGAPFGNTNGAKGKIFLDALRKELVQNPDKLQKIARKLIQAAEDGEPWAIEQVANRFDGKPAQQIDLGNANDQPFQIVAGNAEQKL